MPNWKKLIVSGSDAHLNSLTTATFVSASSLQIDGSGSTLLSVDGSSGRLFSVTDDLSDSLFSANTIAGLPVLEVFSDNTVKIGTFNDEAITVTGNETATKNLTADGFISASGDVYIDGGIYDNNNTLGTPDQVLFTTSTGVEWRDNIAQEAEDLVITGKNLSGGTIAKGTPLYFTGSGTSGNTVGIYPADADNPNRMPAGGVAGESIADDTEGSVYIYGFISGVDTSAFNAGDDVFVAPGGGYTNQKPTGSALIQKLGNVEKVDPTNGSGVIQGPSWYNDLPNWEEGKVKVGISNGQPVTSSVIHLDETNGRIGVGTTSPTRQLHLKGSDDGSSAKIRLEKEGGGDFSLITFDSSNTFSIFDESITSHRLTIDTNGNIGIGTTSPSAKLHTTGVGYFSGGTISFTDTVTNAGIVIDEEDYIYTKDNLNLRKLIGKSLDVIHIGQSGTSLIDEIRLLPGSSGIVTVYDNTAEVARFTGGNVGIGTTSPANKLDVNGGIDADTLNTGQGDNELYAMNQNVRTTDSPSFSALTVGGNSVLTTADEGSGNGLDADTLDGQEGSYYLNFNNHTNKPTLISGSSQVDYNSIQNTPTIGNATITISAGTALTTGGDFTTNQTGNETITINHSSVTRSNTSAFGTLSFGGTFTTVTDLGSNTQGHVTSAEETTFTLPSLPAGTVSGSSQINHDSTTGFVANEHINHANISVFAGNGLSGGGDLTTSRTLAVDLSELTDMTSTMVGTDEFIVLDAGADRRKAANEIGLSIFNNDSGFTTNTGTVTSVGGTGTVNGLTLTGTVTTTGNLTLGGTLSINNGDWSGADLSLANGGTGASLSDPGGDRILFWDDSTGAVTWLSAGTNITISGTTISSTDTNTTYSAGNGITLTGTTFSVAAGGGLTQDAGGLSHSDTSTQASVDNSNGTVIQDVTLDTYGHVTGLTSYNLDGRYYTETEADGKFLLNTTDTLTGDLTVTGKITAQEFHTEFVSASIIYQSGSTQFGDTTDDTHDFTGTVTIEGSGSTVFDIQGSQGQLFSITDSLSGSLFSVNDISGIPILEVFSDDTVKLGTYGSEGLIVEGSNSTVTGNFFVNDYARIDALRVGTTSTDPGDKRLIVEGSAIFNEDGGNYDFRVESDTNPNMIFVDASTDRVGIGTSSPANTLDVNGTLKTSGNALLGSSTSLHQLYGTVAINTNTVPGTVTSPSKVFNVDGDGSDVYGMFTQDGNNAGWLSFYAGATSAYMFYRNTGNLIWGNSTQAGGNSFSEKMRLDSSGNLGIGDSSPSTKLVVNGTATVTTLVETSSRKLKENIQPLESQKEVVDSLQPVSYTWKEGGEKDFGLIAEDVAEIAPDLVSYDNEGNPSAIKYSKLSVLLLDVVKKQNSVIEELSERITKLETNGGK